MSSCSVKVVYWETNGKSDSELGRVNAVLYNFDKAN